MSPVISIGGVLALLLLALLASHPATAATPDTIPYIKHKGYTLCFSFDNVFSVTYDGLVANGTCQVQHRGINTILETLPYEEIDTILDEKKFNILLNETGGNLHPYIQRYNRRHYFFENTRDAAKYWVYVTPAYNPSVPTFVRAIFAKSNLIKNLEIGVVKEVDPSKFYYYNISKVLKFPDMHCGDMTTIDASPSFVICQKENDIYVARPGGNYKRKTEFGTLDVKIAKKYGVFHSFDFKVTGQQKPYTMYTDLEHVGMLEGSSGTMLTLNHEKVGKFATYYPDHEILIYLRDAGEYFVLTAHTLREDNILKAYKNEIVQETLGKHTMFHIYDWKTLRYSVSKENVFAHEEVDVAFPVDDIRFSVGIHVDMKPFQTIRVQELTRYCPSDFQLKASMTLCKAHKGNQYYYETERIYIASDWSKSEAHVRVLASKHTAANNPINKTIHHMFRYLDELHRPRLSTHSMRHLVVPVQEGIAYKILSDYIQTKSIAFGVRPGEEKLHVYEFVGTKFDRLTTVDILNMYMTTEIQVGPNRFVYLSLVRRSDTESGPALVEDQLVVNVYCDLQICPSWSVQEHIIAAVDAYSDSKKSLCLRNALLTNSTKVQLFETESKCRDSELSWDTDQVLVVPVATIVENSINSFTLQYDSLSVLAHALAKRTKGEITLDFVKSANKDELACQSSGVLLLHVEPGHIKAAEICIQPSYEVLQGAKRRSKWDKLADLPFGSFKILSAGTSNFGVEMPKTLYHESSVTDNTGNWDTVTTDGCAADGIGHLADEYGRRTLSVNNTCIQKVTMLPNRISVLSNAAAPFRRYKPECFVNTMSQKALASISVVSDRCEPQQLVFGVEEPIVASEITPVYASTRHILGQGKTFYSFNYECNLGKCDDLLVINIEGKSIVDMQVPGRMHHIQHGNDRYLYDMTCHVMYRISYFEGFYYSTRHNLADKFLSTNCLPPTMQYNLPQEFLAMYRGMVIQKKPEFNEPVVYCDPLDSLLYRRNSANVIGQTAELGLNIGESQITVRAQNCNTSHYDLLQDAQIVMHGHGRSVNLDHVQFYKVQNVSVPRGPLNVVTYLDDMGILVHDCDFAVIPSSNYSIFDIVEHGNTIVMRNYDSSPRIALTRLANRCQVDVWLHEDDPKLRRPRKNLMYKFEMQNSFLQDTGRLYITKGEKALPAFVISPPGCDFASPTGELPEGFTVYTDAYTGTKMYVYSGKFLVFACNGKAKTTHLFLKKFGEYNVLTASDVSYAKKNNIVVGAAIGGVAGTLFTILITLRAFMTILQHQKSSEEKKPQQP